MRFPEANHHERKPVILSQTNSKLSFAQLELPKDSKNLLSKSSGFLSLMTQKSFADYRHIFETCGDYRVKPAQHGFFLYCSGNSFPSAYVDAAGKCHIQYGTMYLLPLCRRNRIEYKQTNDDVAKYDEPLRKGFTIATGDAKQNRTATKKVKEPKTAKIETSNEKPSETRGGKSSKKTSEESVKKVRKLPKPTPAESRAEFTGGMRFLGEAYRAQENNGAISYTGVGIFVPNEMKLYVFNTDSHRQDHLRQSLPSAVERLVLSSEIILAPISELPERYRTRAVEKHLEAPAKKSAEQAEHAADFSALVDDDEKGEQEDADPGKLAQELEHEQDDTSDTTPLGRRKFGQQ